MNNSAYFSKTKLTRWGGVSVLVGGLLTLLIASSGCSGGGSDAAKTPEIPQTQVGVAGTSGKVCLADHSSYRIEVEGADAIEGIIEHNPLLSMYQGSMGGQIKAVTKTNIADASQSAVNVVVWGRGASIEYATMDNVMENVSLARTGTVTALTAARVDGIARIIYGTENGIGVLTAKDGKFFESVNFFRPTTATVTSINSSVDGEKIIFTTSDGFVQTIGIKALMNQEACADIMSAGSVLKVADTTHTPLKALYAGDNALVMATDSAVPVSIAPTFNEVYWPIFVGMVNGNSPTIVRLINLTDKKIYEVGFGAKDNSYKYFDNFIPTDIAFDGSNLVVAGVAFKKQVVLDFVSTNCKVSSTSDKVLCLMAAARDGSLIKLASKEGTLAIGAGIFTFHNLSDLTTGDHFEAIPVAVFANSEYTPPYIYKLAVEGDVGFVRSPNFLIAMKRSADLSGGSNWTLGEGVGLSKGLSPAVPNDMVVFSEGVVAAASGIRSSGGAGDSVVDMMTTDGTFMTADRGAVIANLSGAGQKYMSVVEMANDRGGNLFLENSKVRNQIADITYQNSFISKAAYNGQALAFSWSSTGTANTKESQETWRLCVQMGLESLSRGTLEIKRSGDGVYFDGFPGLALDDKNPDKLRRVGDMVFVSDSVFAVLYTGFKNDKWYYQAALYKFELAGSAYKISLMDVMTPVTTSGGISSLEAKLLKIEENALEYKVYFTATDGIYTWQTRLDSDLQTGAQKIIPLVDPVDVTIDPVDTKRIVVIYNDRVIMRDITKPEDQGSEISLVMADGTKPEKYINGRSALLGNTLAITLPSDPKLPFIVFNLAVTPPAVTVCKKCSVSDVEMYKTYPNYLLTSSFGSGVEIYNVGGK